MSQSSICGVHGCPVNNFPNNYCQFDDGIYLVYQFDLTWGTNMPKLRDLEDFYNAETNRFRD